MDTIKRTVRVISLRPEQANDDSFENALRNAGHKVTVLSSTEPAFSLVNSSWPDVVMFDPVSQFGMSGSIQRLRSSFDGLIVAAGHIPDPTITSMLEELGIVNFAESAAKLRVLVDNAPFRKSVDVIDPYEAVTSAPETSEVAEVVPAAEPGARQLLLTEPVNPQPEPTVPELSGEFLPVEIDGIEDRAVIEKTAAAFWGDTTPDAFVTVNGEPIVVSEYGAFVVDYPLDDGANFIEVLASDFQGRTTRKSFTVVSLQS